MCNERKNGQLTTSTHKKKSKWDKWPIRLSWVRGRLSPDPAIFNNLTRVRSWARLPETSSLMFKGAVWHPATKWNSQTHTDVLRHLFGLWSPNPCVSTHLWRPETWSWPIVIQNICACPLRLQTCEGALKRPATTKEPWEASCKGARKLPASSCSQSMLASCTVSFPGLGNQRSKAGDQGYNFWAVPQSYRQRSFAQQAPNILVKMFRCRVSLAWKIAAAF